MKSPLDDAACFEPDKFDKWKASKNRQYEAKLVKQVLRLGGLMPSLADLKARCLEVTGREQPSFEWLRHDHTDFPIALTGIIIPYVHETSPANLLLGFEKTRIYDEFCAWRAEIEQVDGSNCGIVFEWSAGEWSGGPGDVVVHNSSIRMNGGNFSYVETISNDDEDDEQAEDTIVIHPWSAFIEALVKQWTTNS